MQILGKRSKVLLIAISIAMLVALGVSFATWDSMSKVQAASGNASQYANAQVGDVITFGEYYQDIDQIDAVTKEYKKTPIEWIVVDKDERTGQLTLLSKKILACGSYFGNYYAASGTTYAWNYSGGTSEVGGIPYNQAYVDSTARAFLNNLERLDMGGDSFDATHGYIPSAINSTKDTAGADGKFTPGTGLLSSVGFSNQRYWTGFTTLTAPTLEGKSGIFIRPDVLTKNDEAKTQYYEFYYQRPITSDEYKERPVTRGFLDEAFTDEQKSMIVPKQIAGYTGHRWPDSTHDVSTKSYVEGAVDKVWLPSATELNVANGHPWNYDPNDSDTFDDAWTNPSDETGSTVFEYFKNYSNYTNPVTNKKNTSVADAVKTERTTLAKNGKVGNYSIPVYDKGTTTPKTAISTEKDINSSDHYWTRSPMSYWFNGARFVHSSGVFSHSHTSTSTLGVRPALILSY